MDGRFSLAAGKPASHHMGYDALWRHYLDVFDELVVVGRVSPHEDPHARPIEGPGVKFVGLPSYHGPAAFARTAPSILKILTGLIDDSSAYILRVPGTIPTAFSHMLRLRGLTFSTECVADPADQLGAGSVKHPLRALFRKGFIEALKWQCRTAAATTYVTGNALQSRYPPRAGSPTFAFTDVVLDKSAYVDAARAPDKINVKLPTVVNVGMMTQMYKGQDTLIEAVRLCRDRGQRISVRFIGDGPARKHFEQLARKLNVEDSIFFRGKIAGGAAVRAELDDADIFAMPSRQEGLPRAMLEAMARGLPCVATRVGGIPELLDDPDLLPVNDPQALAEWLLCVATNATALHERSKRNLELARRYSFESIQASRVAFHEQVALATRAVAQR